MFYIYWLFFQLVCFMSKFSLVVERWKICLIYSLFPVLILASMINVHTGGRTRRKPYATQLVNSETSIKVMHIYQCLSLRLPNESGSDLD